MNYNNNSEIDFVIPWVDNSDVKWQQEFAKYNHIIDETNNGACRYRDYGILKYWFRSVEENAPWVRKIFFVTCGQIPPFLKPDHPKIIFVNHKDYIPGEYLPTFSSRTIELNFHRIQGLSEQFVYFNDDMFINQKLSSEYFFRNGKPCYFYHHIKMREGKQGNAYQCARKNALEVINRHFSQSDLLKAGIGKVIHPVYKSANVDNIKNIRQRKFLGFHDQHMAAPMLKSTMEEVWREEKELLQRSCRYKTRNVDGVNEYIFRYWDMARGNFEPEKLRYHLWDLTDAGAANLCAKDIITGNPALICANDAEGCQDWETCRDILVEAFEQRYPQKSSFEL